VSSTSWTGTGRVMAEAWLRGRYVLADLLSWTVALVVVSVFRYDLSTTEINRAGLVIAIAIALLAQFLAFVYQRPRYRYGTLDEIVFLGLAAGIVSTVLVLVSALTTPRLVPISVALAGPAAALSLMIITRWVLSRLRHRLLAPPTLVKRTLVLGAGAGGTQAISMMLADPDSALKPVGILDDDITRRHLRISGVRVLGKISDITEIAARVEAQVAVLAFPSATPSR